MERSFQDVYFLYRSVLFVNGEFLKLFQSPTLFRTVDDFSEDGVLAVQVSMLGVRDEKLSTVRIGLTGVGHGDHAANVVPQRWPDLILERFSVYWSSEGFPRIGGRRVSGLKDETGDRTVEDTTVVIAGGAKRKEILCGFGDGFAKYFDLQIAQLGVKRDGHYGNIMGTRRPWGGLSRDTGTFWYLAGVASWKSELQRCEGRSRSCQVLRMATIRNVYTTPVQAFLPTRATGGN